MALFCDTGPGLSVSLLAALTRPTTPSVPEVAIGPYVAIPTPTSIPAAAPLVIAAPTAAPA